MRQIGEICQALSHRGLHVVLPKRTMEQCALTFLGTIAFVPPHVVEDCNCFLLPSPVPWCFRDLLLDFSRLLGLTLHPFAPVFRCHREIFATLEAGTCAGKPRVVLLPLSSPLVFWDGHVLKRIQTAYEEISSQWFRRSCFSSLNLFFTHYAVHCCF